jgi:hypothetical protein
MPGRDRQAFQPRRDHPLGANRLIRHEAFPPW